MQIDKSSGMRISQAWAAITSKDLQQGDREGRPYYDKPRTTVTSALYCRILLPEFIANPLY